MSISQASIFICENDEAESVGGYGAVSERIWKDSCLSLQNLSLSAESRLSGDFITATAQ